MINKLKKFLLDNKQKKVEEAKIIENKLLEKKEKEKLLVIARENERLQKIEKQVELERKKAEEQALRDKKINEQINSQIKLDKKDASIEEIKHILQIISNIKSVINGELKRELVDIDYSKVKKLFINSYKDTYMIDEVSNFEAYVTKNIRKLIFEYLGISYSMLCGEDLDYNTKAQIQRDAIEQFNYQISNYNFGDVVYEILNSTKEMSFEDVIVEKISEDFQKEENQNYESSMKFDTLLSYVPLVKYLVKLIIHLVNCVMSIIYLITLSRGKNELIQDNEMFTLADNLYGQFNEEEAIEKFFSIYEQLYDTELKKIEKENFFRYLVVKQKKKLNLELMFKFSFEYMNNNQVRSISYYKYVATENNVLKRLDLFTNEAFEDIIFNYLIKDLDKGIPFRNFYSFIIINYIDELQSKDLIRYIFDWWDVESNLKDKRKIIRIEKEKERYLKGDFSKELNREKEKIKLENVKDGIRFENYLKYIFEKMGYCVEITKITGDQGADLILSKSGVRTAVQAKFYSTPVGNKAIQEVVASMKIYNASEAMVVTNNYYTSAAKELAKANGVTLWDKDNLENIILNLV